MADAELDIIEEPEQLRLFSDLLDRCFALPQGKHFLDDFPIWSERGPAPIARIGVFSGGKLASCAGVRIAPLKTDSRELPIALIGAVATDPEFRGHGYASRIVELACAWARERGAALAVLWGSEHTLYQKLGFELCGEQVKLSMRELKLKEAPATSIQKGWTPGILKLLRARWGGIALKDSDRDWLEGHRNVEWYWTGPASAPEAYLAIGRGIDLSGMIHEWGGEREALARLLALVQKSRPELFLLGHPQPFRSMGFRVDESTIEYLCLAKILDPERVIGSYAPRGIELKSADHGWDVHVSGHELQGVSNRGLAQLLFGPKLEGSVAAELNLSGLPLPLWLWGLDSA